MLYISVSSKLQRFGEDFVTPAVVYEVLLIFYICLIFHHTTAFGRT